MFWYYVVGDRFDRIDRRDVVWQLRTYPNDYCHGRSSIARRKLVHQAGHPLRELNMFNVVKYPSTFNAGRCDIVIPV